MEWFTRIDGVDELDSAQSFFDFFALEVDPQLVRSRHLHILHDFHQRLNSAIPLHFSQQDDPTRADWQLARRLLAASYQHCIAGPLVEQSGLAVYQRHQPSFIPWDDLLALRS